MSDARDAGDAGDTGEEGERKLLACEECISPAEAFAVVGNETRLEILEALWRVERPVSFSALRREVGMRDSAQFNYHLSKLTGQFVRKVDDGDGGYEFRQAGRAVIRAVLAGTLNQDPQVDPFDVEGECVDCGGSLQAEYHDENLRIVCPECGRPHGAYEFPPGGLEDRTREEVVDAFNQRARHLACLSKDGVCPECNGRVETTIERTDGEGTLGLSARVEYDCQRCHLNTVSSVGLALLDDAEVVSFYRDHGIDLNDVPYWTLEWCVTDRHTTVESEDPWRLRVDITLGEGTADEETLVARLDGSLSVIDTERHRAGATA